MDGYILKQISSISDHIHFLQFPLRANMELQGPDLASCLKQPRKTDRLYKITIFKRLDVRQQRAVISERWEINEMSPMITPGYCCLEKFSTPENKERELRESKLPVVNKKGEKSWKYRETKLAKVHKTKYQRRESYKERTLESCRVLISKCISGNYWRNNYPIVLQKLVCRQGYN